MPGPNSVEAQSSIRTTGGDVESALLGWTQLTYQDLSRNRFAEEREWYETALFYQRRQWLKWDNSNRRWSLVKQDPSKPRPMPVTNHFARTIDSVSNQLSSGKMKTNTVPQDDGDANRRGAEFAEMAIKAIDQESHLPEQIPLLGKHCALWGIGVTKDYYDASASNGTVRVPVTTMQPSTSLGCLDCGQITDLGAILAANAGAPTPGQQEAPCPQCGSQQTVTWPTTTPQTQQVKEFSKGRLVTEVRPIFEFFLPRNCQNLNRAPKYQQRYRIPISEAKRLYPDKADEIKGDTKIEIHEVYLEALRSLVNYNYMHDQAADSCTIMETWTRFDQLPEDLQDKVRDAVQAGLKRGDEDAEEAEPDGTKGESNTGEASLSASGASGVSDDGQPSGDSVDDAGESEDGDDDQLGIPDAELDPIEQLEQYGIFVIEANSKILDWGINACEGKFPATFYVWKLDPANAYNPGLGSDLIPLQKRLNRLDSLIELAFMSNAAGKWLWPTTQTTKPPTGSPSDVVEWDPVGDAKIAPSFVAPTPVHASVWELRQSILADFQSIGMTQGVQQGQAPSGVNSFRGLAYLGAKGAEQISTQRYLWEQAHSLRYEKCLILARRNWSEGRKTKVAGFNGRWGMKELFGRDLEGEYIMEIQPDSSKPQTLEEKENSLMLLLQGGLIDPTDSQTREYIIGEIANVEGCNLTDHLQYEKAERDLTSVIAGNMPPPNPFANLEIFLKTFANFTLTEEFEGLAPDAQQRVMEATTFINQTIQQQQMAMQAQQMQQAAMMQGPPKPGDAKSDPKKRLSDALQAKMGAPGKGLNAIPGQNITTEGASVSAAQEGSQIAGQLP